MANAFGGIQVIGGDARFPIARDVSAQEPEAPAVVRSAAPSKSSAGLVTVMGFDKNDVLLSSDKVGTVQWRGSDGSVVALLVRMKPGMWGFSRKGDSDWEENLKIFGNSDS